jgi:ribosomal-protein-alanine N-acetyltransferase
LEIASGKFQQGEIMYLAQPKIETERLIMEAPQEKDLQDIFRYSSDPQITRYLMWDAHKNIDHTRQFLEWIKASTSHMQGKIWFSFALRLKKNKRVIGTISFKNIKPDLGQIDYALSPQYWQKGLMSEAAKAVTDWAFKTLPQVKRIQACCLVDNVGSIGVMKKIGMSLEGIRKRDVEVRGELMDRAYYVMESSSSKACKPPLR